jgi:ribose transport system permease protein
MPSSSKGQKNKRNFQANKYMVYFIFVVVLIFFAIWLGPNFFSMSNLMNITRQTGMISVMAVAMTFVIGAGQIDLSIGSTVALASLVSAITLQKTDNIPLALGLTLLLGAFIGLINGILITYVNIPSFLATLGMLSVVKGVAMWTTATKAIGISNMLYNTLFGMGLLFGIPIVLLWTLLALVLGHFALNHLAYGKKVMAIGGNTMSAVYSGIKVNKLTIIVMIVNGIAASFAGIMYSARMQTARYTYGEGDELSVIAAVVLGGTSMSGGSGNIIGAVVGSLLLGVINNGLIIGGLNVSQQMVVRGAIIILAVALSTIGNRKKTRN